ncbi:hypothetical protein BC937DRAFT_91082 [Endogone sp. FLAS-F59071]|nr:hypothetical protein BC937DRAFT_91082 [Endogone sp. FLAS-F59071]|eukprot:RUS16552.1 hypothetical protein BC937DRAFT_91082 [Endogone sp. FLAS-F59071]
MDTLYTFKIPETIITDILDLVSSDIATLHSCLLANRYLFHATVSHLYANPFPLFTTKARAQSLIETLTFCAVKKPPNRPTINYASLVEKLSIVSLWATASVDYEFDLDKQGNFKRAKALIVALVQESIGNLKELHWSSYPLVEFGIPNIILHQGCLPEAEPVPARAHVHWRLVV